MNSKIFIKILDELDDRMDILDAKKECEAIEALESFYEWFVEEFKG